jgi:hypothetical protein
MCERRRQLAPIIFVNYKHFFEQRDFTKVDDEHCYGLS